MSRSTITRSTLLGIALLFSMTVIADAASASCDWRVTGTLSVEHDTRVRELGTESPLENIQVRVKARDKVLGVWGTWNSWGEVRTDDDGRFTVDSTKDCSNRQFKVDVKFQDSELEVRHSTSTSSLTKVHWYEVFRSDGAGHSPSTVNLGELVFGPVVPGDLGDFEARRHADTWVLYKQAIALMASFGENFEFQTQVKIKPIHDGITGDAIEAPYANPTTKVIYIIANSRDDWFGTQTLLHELGHVWAYNHSTGESCLTESLILEGDTHGTVSDPCVAFHEGFAEFWMERVANELFGSDTRLPLNRSFLNSGLMEGDVVSSLALMQRNDEGWRSVFNTLVVSDLGAYHYYEPSDPYPGSETIQHRYGAHLTGGCAPPVVDFRDVLRLFLPKSDAGYDYDLDDTEMRIGTFLTRAEGILDGTGMTDGDAELLRRIVDPAGSSQPFDLFCE